MENNNPQDNIGCLGWIFSLLFEPLEKEPIKETTTVQRVEKNKEPEPVAIPDSEPEVAKKDYSQAYQAKYLLTKNEYREFGKLQAYAEAKGLRICPKVRLLDLIEPRHGEGYMSLLGKIQSKHVDFVITDKALHVKAILELDDNSHNRPDRQERDIFVDEVLTSVGYKVIRTRSVTEETLRNI